MASLCLRRQNRLTETVSLYSSQGNLYSSQGSLFSSQGSLSCRGHVPYHFDAVPSGLPGCGKADRFRPGAVPQGGGGNPFHPQRELRDVLIEKAGLRRTACLRVGIRHDRHIHHLHGGQRRLEHHTFAHIHRDAATLHLGRPAVF